MKKNNTLSIVGIVGLPACYGGFETLAEYLVKYNTDFNISVYCSSSSYKNKEKNFFNARLIYLPLKANGINSIFYDVVALFHAAFIKKSDSILVLGVSGSLFMPIVRLFSTSKVVTNIDGLEWKRQKWSFLTKKFLKFLEYIAVHLSHSVITDNAAITDYVKNEYGVDSTTISYGGDHAVTDELCSTNCGFALSICRIEPENNIDLILKSFSLSTCRIKFIGNWDNTNYGKMIREKYQHFPNIELLDPIYDPSILFQIRQSCSFYVHGHSAGGTNPSLVEMMHFGKQIFAFDCVYNRATTENNSYFFDNAYSLLFLINHFDYSTNNQLQNIARKRYTWRTISHEYYSLINRGI